MIRKKGTHLGLKLFPNSVLFISLDDEVVIIEVFNDETPSLVHRQQNLLHCRIAMML